MDGHHRLPFTRLADFSGVGSYRETST